MAGAIMAAAIEIGIDFGNKIFNRIFTIELENLSFLFFILGHIVAIGLVEELTKFIIVRQKVLNDKEFDEPLDAMLYMIITALGFAALENLLYLSPFLLPSWFPEEAKLSLREAALVTGFRFVGATFLHALASGLIGYFLAYSMFFPKRKRLLLVIGIITASILHGLFNISIIGLSAGAQNQNPALVIIFVVSLITILSSLAIFVSFGFNKLKKLKSICQQTSSTD